MACDPPNIPTKEGIVGKPSKNGAQRRREYSVQRTGNEIIDRNLDQIRQALRENDRGLLTVENLVPALVAASATGTGTPSGSALGSVPITNLANGTIRFVDTFRSFFRLDATNSDGWTADGVSYIAAMGGVGMWVRLPIADPYWATLTDWYIDPAGTYSVPGNDEGDGSILAPIKSIAEWRRRINGAVWTGSTRIKIHALSSSTVMDDGQFYGFTTEYIANTHVVVLGVPTVVGTGTITAYQPYSGNTRGSITASAIPVSWTASDWVSTPTASRYIRKTGAGAVHYASLLKDLGSKTIQMGPVSDWDPSNPLSVTFVETNFTNGDSFEVVSMPRWPQLQSHTANVRYQCLDVFDTLNRVHIFTVQQNNFVLCGFVDAVRFDYGNTLAYNCAFLGSSTTGVIGPILSSFLNAIVQPLISSTWKGQFNVLIGCRLYLEHGSVLGDTGTVRVFDTSDPCIQCSTRATTNIFSMVGEGNTGKLVYVDRGSQIYGAGNVTATTSDVSPYYVAGTSYATPVVSAGTGDGIYN